MADIKLLDEIRSSQKPPAIPGGRRRPSQQADLREFPLVRRRQELNRMLLTNGCGNGGATDLKFRPSDLKLLVQIAGERGENVNPLLRRQAIRALGEFRELDAAAALARLERSELEDAAVRRSAAAALRELSPDLGIGLPAALQKPAALPNRKGKASAPPKDGR